MSYIYYDPDEWETVHTHTPCHSCGDDMRKCNGMCTGSSSWGQKRRAPEDVARIKAEKRKAHEDAVLFEADLIRARRDKHP